MIVYSRSPVNLFRCHGNNDPVYCCEFDTYNSCCGDGNTTFHFIPGAIQGVLDDSGIFGTIAPGAPTLYTSTSHTSTPLSSGSPSTTPPTLSSPTATPSVSSQAMPSSTAASPSATVIGLSVGISLVVVTAVAAFGALFFRRRRQQNLGPQQEQFPEMPPHQGLVNRGPNELPGVMEPRELSGERPVMTHMK